MREKCADGIAQALQEVPEGTLAILQNGAQAVRDCHAGDQLTTQIVGKGRIERYRLYPGIEISCHQYLAQEVHFCHRASDSVLEINHCRQGRIGWKMSEGISVYLGAGDLCLHTRLLPLGYYEGIDLTVDLERLRGSEPEILREAGMDAAFFERKFCSAKVPMTLPACAGVEQIFAPLYQISQQLRAPYYKLKAQEVLLYLGWAKPEWQQESNQYVSQQTELIRQIHDFLVQHLDQRFTIEELAKRYLINTSSLKSVFKAVYGVPLASYVKEYRIQQAMKLLRETDDSIAQIAKQVGYETQGKFTKAFCAGSCGRRAGPELHRAVGCLFAHDARGLPCGRSATGVLPPHHPADLWRGGGRDAFHSAAGWGAGRHAVSVWNRGADGHSAADSGHKAAQKDAENR